MKKILLTILLIFSMIFVNGCYYVFHGQFKSAEKLEAGKELNIYECFSIYTMHIVICLVGPIYSPEATQEILRMSFPSYREKTIIMDNSFFMENDYVASKAKNLNGRVRIAFKDSSYSIHNKNHRVALAANPGFLYKDKEYLYFEVPVHYPKCTNTHIGKIVVNECLFSYLEEHHILHPYTVVYRHKL